MHCISPSDLSHRLVAVCFSALLAAPLSLAAQQAAPAPQFPDAPAPSSQPVNLETAMAGAPSLRLFPGARVGNDAASSATASSAPVPEGWSSSQAQQAPGAQDADRQNKPQKPVGTAVGPVTNPTGVAGARPSGAAIAPAKQRRVHAFYIRAAIIVAALGATGIVIALSHSSSSRPQ